MVATPHIGQKELYVTSGHYAKYGEDSFQPMHTPKEEEEFLLKPMNCPHHCEIFIAPNLLVIGRSTKKICGIRNSI